MEKIDWLKEARQYTRLAITEIEPGTRAMSSGGSRVPLEIRVGYAAIAQACIAMHNAEREQERQVVSIPPQPQPFDCEEAYGEMLQRAGSGNETEDYCDGMIAALNQYCRSLNIPVKNDPS